MMNQRQVKDLTKVFLLGYKPDGIRTLACIEKEKEVIEDGRKKSIWAGNL